MYRFLKNVFLFTNNLNRMNKEIVQKIRLDSVFKNHTISTFIRSGFTFPCLFSLTKHALTKNCCQNTLVGAHTHTHTLTMNWNIWHFSCDSFAIYAIKLKTLIVTISSLCPRWSKSQNIRYFCFHKTYQICQYYLYLFYLLYIFSYLFKCECVYVNKIR